MVSAFRVYVWSCAVGELRMCGRGPYACEASVWEACCWYSGVINMFLNCLMAWRLGGGGSRQPGLSTPRSMIPPVFFRAVAHASSIAAESNSGEGNPSLFATVCTKHCVPFRFDAGGAVRRKAQFVVRGACALQQTAMHSVGVV